MYRRWLPFLTVILGLLFTKTILGQDKDIIPGQLLVLLKHEKNVHDLTVLPLTYQQNPIRLHHQQVLIQQINLHLFTYDTSLVPPQVILDQIRKLPPVQIAQFNHKVDWRQIQATFPNDPNFSNQWGLHNTGQSGGTPDADIDAPEAWNIAQGGLSVLGDTLVAAVIDGGMALNHPDLIFWKNHQEIPGNGIDDDNNG
ncbi:MAG: hypothetical protein KDD99_09185, partial [Bacteroidetes bacterium]|nr:hypothetical protein [Bacteroidota bacterium]